MKEQPPVGYTVGENAYVSFQDNELHALAAAYHVISAIDRNAQARVMDWLADRIVSDREQETKP